MTGWRPGDRRPDRASMVRVDQAGEYGATRIYAGQLAVLRRNCPEAKLVARMAAQEERHLKRFNALVAESRVRPTALQPLWNVAGFALGAATALMSEKAALACTDAVETEIDRHYAGQLAALGDDDPELSADIAEFQA
ncbi:MAG: 3-demethoxyubiquinol 3-hydroxylase, partial [Sphingomonadales bacterium]|nr:3-demethoxyubiquinol 3-hydroxylase [Sphingomonadales bacterium]